MAIIYSGNYQYGYYNGGVALVGITGVGSLVGNGGSYYTFGAIFGVYAGSTGTGTLSNNTQVDIGSYGLHVGLYGRGTVTIGGGSVVNSTGAYFDNASIGEFAGSVGTLTVTGAGSQLFSSGSDNAVNIARNGGTGTLNVLAGGLVETLGLYVARAGNGTVNVSGVGSHLLVSNDNGSYSSFPSQAGFASFGGNAGSRGTLNVTAGGVVDIRDTTTEDNPALRLGLRSGSVGIGIVDGAGSQINISQQVAGAYGPNLQLGVQGDGTLTVRNGGAVNITGDNATLFVSGGWDVDGLPPTALLAQSELIIQTGGVVTVTDAGAGYDTVSVGTEQFGNGAIRISGAGSKLVSIGTTNDEINIGNRGTGLLTIGTGGEVIGRRMFVGYHAGSTGTVQISGAGSKLTLESGDAYAGSNTAAALFVSTRGNSTFTVSAAAHVDLTGAQAHLFVGDGYGLSDYAGKGTLNIQSGAKVTVTNTDAINQRGAIDIGTQEFGDGTVTVTGVGSTLTAAGTNPYISVGSYGKGELNVLAGGKVVSLGMAVGNDYGGNGTLNITGAGSKVVLSNDTHTAGFWGDTYGGSMDVGSQAGSSGVMNITAGGVLEIRNTTDEVGPFLGIGNRQDSVGVVTVDGVGSAINMKQTGGTGEEYGPFFGVGNRGAGTLTVKNNAQINLTGAYGQFRVSRGNSLDDPVVLPEAPLSEAFILSGADVTINMSGGTSYGAAARIAQEANSNGRLTIDGTGSTLNVLGNNLGNLDSEKANLIVAQQGTGELIVTNGADVFINGGDDKHPHLTVGQESGSYGTLSITGVGSTINLLTTNIAADGGGLITVGRGDGSNGVMNISTGAQVINDLGSSNSAMTVGANATSVGLVTVDGNGNVTTLLDAGQLLVVGAGWDELGSTLANVSFTGAGTGSVMVLGGATVRANDTAVGDGGTIGGNGKFDGNVTVDGGDLIIGTSPGILTITGVLNVANTTLDFEVNGLTAGTLHDQIKVTGAVTLTDVPINLNIDGKGFNFSDGNRIVLIDGTTSLTVDIDAINEVITDEPAGLAYSIGDEGADLVFEALNSGAGAALVSFGATSTIGATATINDGVVTGNGGRFNSVRTVGATGIEGTAGADILSDIGNQAVTLLGLGGNDTINGGTLGDTLDGGAGLDTVSYASSGAGVTVTLAGAALGTVSDGDAAGDLIKNFENIIGSAGIDTLTGDTLANVIEGGAGADILDGKAGLDTVSYASSGAGVTVTVNGTGFGTASGAGSHAVGDTIQNFENVIGSGFNDILTGDGLVNILTGGAGNDRLDGGVGADTMIGGLDDDTYVVGIATDKVTELANQGTDTIETSLTTFSLAALVNVENLTYDNGVLADLAFTGTGNALANTITGGDGADKLSGGAEADTLIGGLGNDTYTVDNADDVVDESGDLVGIDLVSSAVTFSLSDGVIGDVENLTLTGALAINGTGNALANKITGNTGANIIEGKELGDTLDGGAGLDTVSYASSGAGVTVTLAGAALGTVSDGDAAGDLIKNFENIIGSAGIDTLTGDTLANVIEGGAGADILDGKAGLDTVSYASSGAGVTVTVNGTGFGTASGAGSHAVGDTIQNFENVIGSGFNDILTGDGLVNILTGGAGNDRLDGGVGADTMIGGLDDDTYVVGIATDKVTELANQGTDTIETSLTTFSLAALVNVENLTYDNGVLADLAFTGTGNALANTITGGDGADKLSGGAEADTLIGGLGNDTYTVDNADDVVDESGDLVGIDLVSSAVTFSLSDGVIGDVENLTLTGALAINGTGNALANKITGNTGANIIEGKELGDTLDGGAGLDTVSYASSGAGVTVTLAGAALGTVSDGDAAGDLIKNFENIIGSAGIDTLTGDTLANVIEGGAGADILDGKAGLDTVSYASSGAGVTVTVNGTGFGTASGAGSHAVGDTIQNFENVIGSGFNDILTGDGLVNILTGGAGNDRLDGGVGADTMIGGLDDDTYVVGIATDKVTELANQGTDTIETSLTTFSLAALVNVENLTYDNGVLADLAFTGTGNALANTITGGDGADKLSGGAEADTLIGGAGNDTLTGGTQNDQFIFKDFVLAGDFGNDKITDFAGGVGLGDVIQIDGAWGFATEADVLAAFQVVGADKVLTVGSDSITLVGKAGLALSVDDFLII